MNFNVDYRPGQQVKGIVVKIKNYGVFLSFEGGYVGLLHISEVCDNFINDLSLYFSIGDEVLVAIKKVDESGKFLTVLTKDLPGELNKYNSIIDTKKVTLYSEDIGFSKLQRELPKMISDELEREKNEHKS
jgi:predicted RNA-binding protein with RPS1 domain